MTGAADGAGGSAERQAAGARDAGGPAPVKADPALLEKVLLQTQSAAESLDPTSNVDVARLRAVAHRRKDLPLTLEPVVVEMVRAVMAVDFAGLENDPDRFRALTIDIARALMEDPAAVKRLEGLWSKLREQDR